jgi:hypothetical protein
MGRAGSRRFTIPTRGRHGAPSHPRRHLTATRPAPQRPPNLVTTRNHGLKASRGALTCRLWRRAG